MKIQAADYTAYGIILVLSVAAVQLLGQTHPILLFCLALLVLVGGLPHGALDFFILKRLYNRSAFALSLVLYVGVAALNFGVWSIFPNTIFPIFLSYSIYHFGSSDRPDASLPNQLAWGLTAIGLPCLLAPADTLVYFDLFLPSTQSVATINTLASLCIASLALGMTDTQDTRHRLVTILVYSSILTFANVLCAFTFYFVFVHSKIHERNWLRCVPKSDFRILRALTLTVIAGVVMLSLFVGQTGYFPTVDQPLYQFIRYIFLVLGSLTVSHMILAWVATRTEPGHDHHSSQPSEPRIQAKAAVTLAPNQLPG